PSVPVAPAVPAVPVAPAVPAVPVAPAVPSVPAVPVVPVPAALAPEAPPAPPENETAPIAATETRPGQVKKYPVRTDSIGAPHLGERPSAVPMRQLSRKTIADALVQPTEFGSEEAGFKAPDWTQPFRDIQFEQMKSAPNADALELQGDVHLRLGDMYFKSDQFSYDRLMGMIHAEGNIEVTQQASKMTAQEFTYEIPGPEAVPVEGQTPFAPPLTEQERERGRLTLGRLYAKNVYVDEPTRTMSAEEIQYDFATKTGEMLHVHGQAGIYYYSADKLRILGPASAEGDEVWVTTCDRDPPHYKIRLKRAKIEEGTAVGGNSARLQLGSMDTPFFLPTWQRGGVGAYPWTLDFDSGRRADIGYFVNIGQRFEVTPDVALGPRIFPTEKQGVGFGGDLEYDFSKNPASWLYRTKGEAHGLYTTEDRGYLHWYHRYDYDQNLTLRIQAEQWSDSEFYKDFFYDHYRNRSTPRTFANVTYRQEDYIATGTVKLNTHNWINETERFPEATFHVLERPLLDHLYLTFDTVDGFNDREQYGANAVRSVNVLRLTYDWDPLPALAITPFVELEGTWYSKQRADDSAASRFSSLYGVTAQTRFHREYPGRWGFSAFKHVVVPSVTYSYQPEASLDVNSAPRFDNLDNAFGRSRIETKLDNLLYGRDAETKEVWQVARLTLYQGNDLWNEIQKSHDYELELDIRPRPWGGFQLVGERHDVSSEFSLYDYEFQDRFVRFYERVFERPFDRETSEFFDESFQDYNRVLAQLYYEERPLNARIGFSYTETRNEVYNREVLYGLGYEINDNWGVGFEHRYDFEDNTLRSQTYEVRRSLHCWETALRVRDRESGFDIDIEFNIKAFPGTRLKL
ncbi:MAG: hypothetical protein HYV26_10885, partial [Candidatus Hydrogenedentes bacterium]|nr:hypothetical protein [Candidatus Hydrogenedentota bacterium]